MEESGADVPTLNNRPKVPSYLEEICTSFMILHNRRGAGLALNPISLADIAAFVALWGPPALDLEIFVALIGCLDNVFLKELQNGR